MKRIAQALMLAMIAVSTPLAGAQSFASLDFLTRVLDEHAGDVDASMRRLSSGELLWTDDPASRAVFEKLKSHIAGLGATLRNKADLASYYRARDGYLESIAVALQRIRELALAKTDGIYNDDDRGLLDAEIASHYEGILKSLSWAEFNGEPMFPDWIDDESLSTRFAASEFRSIAGVDRILAVIVGERARQGALMNALEFESRGEAIARENATAFLSSGDTDFARESSRLRLSELHFFANLFLLRFRTD